MESNKNQAGKVVGNFILLREAYLFFEILNNSLLFNVFTYLFTFHDKQSCQPIVC